MKLRSDNMLTASVVENDFVQSVRIPEELKTKHKKFIIKKIGEGYLLYPENDPWLPLKISIGQITQDFMTNREQPSWSDISQY